MRIIISFKIVLLLLVVLSVFIKCNQEVSELPFGLKFGEVPEMRIKELQAKGEIAAVDEFVYRYKVKEELMGNINIDKTRPLTSFELMYVNLSLQNKIKVPKELIYCCQKNYYAVSRSDCEYLINTYLGKFGEPTGIEKLEARDRYVWSTKKYRLSLEIVPFNEFSYVDSPTEQLYRCYALIMRPTDNNKETEKGRDF